MNRVDFNMLRWMIDQGGTVKVTESNRKLLEVQTHVHRWFEKPRVSIEGNTASITLTGIAAVECFRKGRR